jgi:hypothetical protein
MAAEGRRAGTRRRIPWSPHLSSPLLRARRAGPAELFAQVAPLLAGGSAGQDALAHLAELLQDDPALIDLRFDEHEVLHAMRALAPSSPSGQPEAERDLLHARLLPGLVPPRFGKQVADALAAASARRADPRDRLALALGRYFAILDDVEGAAGAGQNPLWQLLLDLTWSEANGAALVGRDLLHLPHEDGEGQRPLASGMAR